MSVRRVIRITGKTFKYIKALVNESATSVVVAATTDLSDIDGNYVIASGAGATITGFGNVQAGAERVVKFDGVNTLVYDSVLLVLPSVANISTEQGDTAILRSDGDGNWTCIAYTRASGQILGAPRYSFGSPTNPVGSTSEPGVMMGLGLGISPNRTGVILVVLSGTMQSDTVNSVVTPELRFGTGTAPSNGDAIAGTSADISTVGTMYAAGARQPFTLSTMIEALVLGEYVWIDIVLSNGGDASLAEITDLRSNIIEL